MSRGPVPLLPDASLLIRAPAAACSPVARLALTRLALTRLALSVVVE
ncbi:hypothetical protein OAO87_00870 [bacterium]|nr:hypothetical protein [bacterium]